MLPLPWVEHAVVRQAALDYIDRVDKEWKTGRRTDPEVRSLCFDQAGSLVPFATGGSLDSYYRQLVEAVRALVATGGVSLCTLDWSVVVVTLLGYCDMWVEDEYGLYPGRDVLCPETLQRQAREKFGKRPGWRTVTAQEMRDLIQALPVVSLKPGDWQEDSFTMKWSVQRDRDERERQGDPRV
ncbi:MAG: hypothetical protein ACRERD_33070 [Candidatus Binatia bacterium]